VPTTDIPDTENAVMFRGMAVIAEIADEAGADLVAAGTLG
jgi:hypothetical protein